MSTPSPELPSLTIGIPTFRRAERLTSLLPVVSRHASEALSAGLISSAGVVVVDNDPARSAESTVQAASGPIRITYVSQTIPGIPAVRNAAMDAAGQSRLLAFIDDDESPREGWLSWLVQTWRDHGEPTGVSGLVVSHFPDGTDPWILASGLFTRPQRPTGTAMPVVATGNLLLDLDAVRRFGVRFDESIGLGGGSDTKFSTELSARGARFIWCNESVADDVVEAARLDRAWVLRRSFSHGNVLTRTAVSKAGSPVGRLAARVRGIGGGTARIIVGGARVLWGRLTGTVGHRARGSRLVRRGTGMISGSVGHAFYAYAHDRN